MGDEIDPTAGIITYHKLGDRIESGEPYCTLLSNSQDRIEEAERILENAFTVIQEPVKAPPLIHESF